MSTFFPSPKESLLTFQTNATGVSNHIFLSVPHFFKHCDFALLANFRLRQMSRRKIMGVYMTVYLYWTFQTVDKAQL